MNPLRLFLFGLIIAILIAGCVTAPPSVQQPTAPSVPTLKVCKTVVESTPLTKQECTNISVTDEVCGLRKLNYSIISPPQTDLCITEGECSGKSLGDCQGCTNAMSRCILVIKNEEMLNSGSWTVGANYTLGNYGFNKDPITKVIRANESFAFDFNQIYNPGQPINSASCTIAVISEPSIEDCHSETRIKPECKNVTTITTVQKEVCQ